MYTVYDNLLDIVRRSPGREALTDGRRSLTYACLDRLVDSVRSLFPVSRPRYVGIVMDHGIENIASLLAVLKSGAAYVAAEPSFPPDRIADMMDQASVEFIICSPAYASRFPGIPTLVIPPGLQPAADTPVSASAASPSSPAYILFTSGTTGRPKGVVVSNSNVANYARAFGHEFVRPGETFRMLQHSVCTFDIFVEEVFGTLLNGGTLVICPEEAKTDVTRLCRFLYDQRLNALSSFPYLLNELNKRPELIPASMRLLISGGDVLRASYVDRIPPQILVYNTYGPSETTVCATYFRCNGAAPLPDGTFPIGRPVLGVDVRLFRPGSFDPVPEGEPGEICIYGRGVSLGYLRPCPESANFTVDPSDGRRCYRSGDLGYMTADGNLAFLRRLDRQVMIMGKRVECQEVENVIFSTGDVDQAVVIPNMASDGLAYLTAYIVPKLRSSFSLKSLREKISRRLTPFMVPDYFVKLDRLPLTANGKPDRSRLPVVEMKKSRL